MRTTTKTHRLTDLIPVHDQAVSGRSSYQAYRILYFAFIAVPIIAGFDKFFSALAPWNTYLSPVIASRIDAAVFMKGVGIVEILAGLLVAFRPRIGGFVVAAWLGGIVINLLMTQAGFYDIALRDFGLALSALALGCLAKDYSLDH
jgi:hypothetical protein